MKAGSFAIPAFFSTFARANENTDAMFPDVADGTDRLSAT